MKTHLINDFVKKNEATLIAYNLIDFEIEVFKASNSIWLCNWNKNIVININISQNENKKIRNTMTLSTDANNDLKEFFLKHNGVSDRVNNITILFKTTDEMENFLKNELPKII